MVKKSFCRECGGWGGFDASDFGDRGWHPCYHCGTTGRCDCPECSGTALPPVLEQQEYEPREVCCEYYEPPEGWDDTEFECDLPFEDDENQFQSDNECPF